MIHEAGQKNPTELGLRRGLQLHLAHDYFDIKHGSLWGGGISRAVNVIRDD